MAKVLTQYFFLGSIIFSSFSAASSQDEFSYDPNSTNGPAHWGDIKPEWHVCKDGSTQSPINIDSRTVQVASHLGPLGINYQSSNASLFSTGHDIRLEWTSGAGHLLINETMYILQQCHWHSPSEHSIDGKRFDLEIHMVHKSEAGRVAVIGVFYQTSGSPDLFLQNIMDDLTHISGERGAKIPKGVVDPERVININRGGYYRYMGSLTTPPCDENVVWTISEQVKQVSNEQISALRAAVQDVSYINERPLQQLNGRLVQLQSI